MEELHFQICLELKEHFKINGQFFQCDAPAGNHGSRIHQNKYPVHDSLQASVIEGIGHHSDI